MVVLVMATTACDLLSRGAPYRGTPVVIDDTLLRYPDSSTLALGVGDLAFIGQLDAERTSPFVIVAAHGCEACESPDAVIVRAPAAGRMVNGDTRGAHPYPGRTHSAQDGSVRSYTRLFWGHCLPQRPPGVVSFRSAYSGVGDEPLRDVRITEVHGDSLLDWRTIAEVRLLTATLQQVRAGECTEMPARGMVSAP
jgi:hypothetical protein